MDKNKKIFIAGASGFIGTTLVGQLLADGWSLHTMSRSLPVAPPGCTDDPNTLWNNPNLTHFQGDVCDMEAIQKGMTGCSYVIHLAGYAKNYAKDISTYTQINVQGMRNVFKVAKELEIERIVWTSTIMTLGPTPKKVVGNEEMPRLSEKFFTEYERTKTIAEREAFQWATEGLPLVIVNPTRVYGPGQLSEGNALAVLIDDYMRGKFPFLLNAGVNMGNYVLVDDLARGIFQALEKGMVGQRYILGGENASLSAFLRKIDQVTGKKHWMIPVFRPGALLFSYSQLIMAKLFGCYPRITPGWIRTFLADAAFSSDKAKRDFGYQPTSLDEGLRKTCLWLSKLR